MKVKPDDVEAMRVAIEPHDTPERRQLYIDGKFPRAEVTRDLNMRYRWDLFNRAELGRTVSRMYAYGCNDEHIDTALRSIVPKLCAGHPNKP